jgi:2,4-dienoyl-CoA reductase-like NADH-dependent reductase (Old Yellow Enzyme family)
MWIAREVEKEVEVPIVMIGGLRSFELIEEVIQRKECDFVSLWRPFIREPKIINDWGPTAGKMHLV